MKKIVTLVVAILLLGAGCAPTQPVEQQQPTKPADQTLTPSTTPNEPAPTATAPATGGTAVKLFMVALDDNGKGGALIGCGDSIIPVKTTIPATKAPLSETFKALLAVKSRYYGQSGLYNPSFSDADPNGSLAFSSATITNGTAKIYLTGKLALPGECEDPRFLSQFEETAKQFSTVKKVEIYVNNQRWDGSLK